MKEKTRANLLGIYDLVLSLGAIYIGINMILKYGLFTVYPKEWLTKVPFDSWFMPGVIAIVLFGGGNIIAGFLSLRKTNNKFWLMSALMGGLLFISLIAQVIILGETYMATIQFFILSIIQLAFSMYAFKGQRKGSVTLKGSVE